jgi:SHS family lactate transporter-like MFS transporter
MGIAAAGADLSVPWWKEPNKDQWFAWIAAWLGWMLDIFDYFVFLFIMVPIAKEFGVSVTAVAAVLAVTIWLRLVGAIGSGWLADRIGRKTPLMLSILWYSICNFVAGFSPSFLSCLLSEPCSASEWARNGPSAQVSQWSRGRRDHAASWGAF